MRRLTPLEKKAALIVLGLAITAAESGYRLLKKHTKYMAKKAAAHFRPEDEEAEELAQMAEEAFAEDIPAQETGQSPETAGATV